MPSPWVLVVRVRSVCSLPEVVRDVEFPCWRRVDPTTLAVATGVAVPMPNRISAVSAVNKAEPVEVWIAKALVESVVFWKILVLVLAIRPLTAELTLSRLFPELFWTWKAKLLFVW